MAIYLLFTASVIIACVLCNKLSSKVGMPLLLTFLILGMLFGSDGIVKIQFDNFVLTEQICTIALIFIMFYGGFGTKWVSAKPVALQAIALSSAGTIITAALVGLFCYVILKVPIYESFLIGAVISSTDAASVFSILRSKHLNLRYNTASLLEVESGSNDPFSFMLTILVLTLMKGNVSGGAVAYLLFAQIAFGIIFGFGIAWLTIFFLKKFSISSAGFLAIFMVAVALISYAAPSIFGGNGYLSTYIAGIVIGNKKISEKQELVHFFDGTTGLMQMLLFFMLGLLSFPSRLPAVAPMALGIALFLTFVARPLAVFATLAPFACTVKQKLLISWSGLRGAASIVFVVLAVIDPVVKENDIFHIVFFIVLFSILLQGTLIPFVAHKLNMTDDTVDVMKTFNDYIDEVPVDFIQFSVPQFHHWDGKTISEIAIPPGLLFLLILRDHKKIVPNGMTVIHGGDDLILGGRTVDPAAGIKLHEKTIEKNHSWVGKEISEISTMENLIVLIRRGGDVLIPEGNTVLLVDDVLILM